jgi:hypothetical protein
MVPESIHSPQKVRPVHVGLFSFDTFGIPPCTKVSYLCNLVWMILFTDIVHFNSPSIGGESTMNLNVTAQNADGEIGFAETGDLITEELTDKAKLVSKMSNLYLSAESTLVTLTMVTSE